MQQAESTSSRGKPRLACRMGVVLTGSALFFIVPMAIITALPKMAADFAKNGIPNAQFEAQLVLIVAGLSAILGAPAASLIARHIGKRLTLLIMLLFYTFAGSVGTFESNPAALLSSRAVLGFAGGAIAALSIVLIADYYDSSVRARLLGFSTTIQHVLSLTVIALCGWLVERFGWNSAFAAYPFLGLMMFFAALFAVDEPLHVGRHVNHVAPRYGWLKAIGILGPSYLIILGLLIALFMAPIQGPFLLVAIGITKASVQGMLLASPNITSTISAAVFGYLSTKFSERRVLISITLAIGMTLIASGLSSGVLEMLLYLALIGLCTGISAPLAFEMVIVRSPESFRGTAVGLILSLAGVGQLLNPLICAPINRLFGIKGAFIGVGCGVVVMAAAITVFSYGHSIERHDLLVKYPKF